MVECVQQKKTGNKIWDKKYTSGICQYIWQPGLAIDEPDRLLGYPVYTSAYVPAIAAGQPVMAFGDFSYYNIGDRGTRTFAALHELYGRNRRG